MKTLTDAVVQSDNAKKSMKTSTVINVKSSVADAVANDPSIDVSSADEVHTQVIQTFWQVFFSFEPAVTKYNRSAPCTINAWFKALPFELLFSIATAVLFISIGPGFYVIHREYFSSNMYDAMWCGVLLYFVLLIGQHMGFVAARHSSADLNKRDIYFSLIGNITGANLYVLLSLAIGIGPFSSSGVSKSWAHLAWIQFVSMLAGFWFACCVRYLSPAFRRMYKDHGITFRNNLKFTLTRLITCSISQISSAIVTFVITYFSQGEQTLQNQAIEVLIVGVAYPCIRIGWRLWNTRSSRGLYGKVDGGFIERLMNYEQIIIKQCFGMVGSIMTSLMLSWTSYVISLMANAVVEICSELLTLRRQLRSHRKNPKTSLQDLLNMQAFRISVSNEADQVVPLIAPLVAGSLMEIVLRSTNPDAAFVGWYALLLRIPIGLFVELVIDLTKTLVVHSYFDVNVLGVQRQRKIWNVVMITFTAFSVPGCTLVGMCLAQ